MSKKITHYELCRLTAEWGMNKFKAWVGFWEVNTTFYNENPDVLLYREGETTLFEIKVSRPDFLSDKKKESRIKKKLPKFFAWNYNEYHRLNKEQKKKWKKDKFLHDKLFIEKPHLGASRYYVCPEGLITIEDIKDRGWGLYWFKNGRFFLKKKSEKFQSNKHKEMMFLELGMRKLHEGHDENIIIKAYKK